MATKKSIDDMVFEAVRREIVEIFPEKVEGKTKDEIDKIAEYVAEGFYDFIKDEISDYFADSEDD